MTEEEKKAIEILKKWVCDVHSKFCKIGAVGIPDKEWYATETVLNLIQKQDTEINKLNNIIDETIDYIKDNYDKFDKIEIENNAIKETRYIHKFNIEYLLNILDEERRGEYE